MLLAVATALLLVLSHVFRREASAKTQHTKNKGENPMSAENTTATETAELTVSIRADYFWHAAQFVSEEQTGGGYEALRGVCIEPAAEGVIISAMDGHQLCCWHDAAGYADKRRVIMPTADMLGIVKPSFSRRGHTPGNLSVNGAGAWLLTRGRTSISGIKAFDITQEFPGITPFIARAFGFQPSAEAVTLPALNLARFAFGKLSLCLTLTALDDGRMVSVTNSQEPDFFGLIMGMLPTPEDPRDLRTPAFIRRMLGMDEPEDPIVVTQPEPEPLPDITPENDEDAPAISDTEPQAAQPERPESRATRKRRRAVRRVSRHHVPETEPQAAPLALPASPAPLLPAVVAVAPVASEEAPQDVAGAIPMPAAPIPSKSDCCVKFRTARAVRRQARRVAPHHAVPASRPAAGFPGVAVGLAVMLAFAGTIGGRGLELVTLLLSQALA
jgi:hypothetical protein